MIHQKPTQVKIFQKLCFTLPVKHCDSVFYRQQHWNPPLTTSAYKTKMEQISWESAQRQFSSSLDSLRNQL